MNAALMIPLFCLMCLAILTLPFVPAYAEWRSPADCSPLPISRQYSNEIDHFARRFRSDALADIATHGPTSEQFEYVNNSIENMDWLSSSRPLIGLRAINSAQSIRCNRSLYASSGVDCGRDSSFAALLVCGDIALGPYSEILEWAHADGSVKLDTACVALRRLSSNVAIDLATQCCFERVSAPIIRFGQPCDEIKPDFIGCFPGDLGALPESSRRAATLHVVKGDCTLPPGHIYKGSLVVTGRLTIGNNTTLIGDIKAREGIIVGSAARIIGSLVCEDRIYLLDHVEVAGPIISETDIVIGAGTIIGRPDAPTTISAENIIAKSGARSHGTLWARNVGVVWAP